MSGVRVTVGNLEELGALWQGGGSVHDRAGGAARAWICPEGPILALLPDARQATELLSDHRTLFPDRSAHLLNAPPLTIQTIGSRPLALQRGETMQQWLREGGLLVATPGALMPPCLLGEGELPIKKGESYARDRLLDWLDRSGYQRSDLVWSPGHYVARGFILDVFDPAYALPLRFEFFDEAVERICSFHPSTQKSAAELDSIELHSVAGATPSSPANLLPQGTRLLLFDPQKIEGQALSFHWLWEELRQEIRVDPIPHWDELFALLARLPRLRLTRNLELTEAQLDIDSLPPFRGDFLNVLRLCHSLHEQDYTITLFSTNPRFLDRESGPFSALPFVELCSGRLSSGFADRARRRAFLSDRELSGVSAASFSMEWHAPQEWRERLASGQLVVHEDYGVGIFRGIEEIATGGETLDALTIEFAEQKRLLIPVMQSHKLTPLAEHESDETVLDSLKSTRWRKSQERDRKRAEEEARLLVEIFARRELERRDPLPEGGELYAAFEEAFPHTETADQLKAVREIMEDLSGPFPMDRLLVGDVGFGKTEVALRAAFRSVVAGRQVCVLVPTTILAQQHYATFQSRLSGFPVSVGLLSRFVSRTEARRTKERAADGTLDILIGTHKLLQKGVEFRNLGLLVVDEEHRFGVMHKENLKNTHKAVDILSLSATPIPRTLAMALRGLRNFSLLETPPVNRLPVTTFAGPWRASLARKAVTHELTRGGQVYFVVNRIARMEDQQRMLAAFFPDARIALAHGQMPERELEKTMLDFYSGNVDILICTTIIESGLDVGRANTIIVDDSQELGLAQMYQLRGRVGRREENGFAYFFYPEKEELRRETADRLEAISTLTDLGSGYAIARRDLDIRGGGEIGGSRQHGVSRGAGFHSFYRMLEQELTRLRGGSIAKVEVSFDRAGSIPEFYIPQEGVRVTLYRRLLQAIGMDEFAALANEITDRFGPLPDPVKLLIAQSALRNCGAAYGLRSVSITRSETRASGDLKELGPRLKALRTWTVLGDQALGPGGLAGVRGLYEAMSEPDEDEANPPQSQRT
ncbi:MAG: DEAD/DEAH box helicase [Fretibacterium sp.]|nr:DEAD/DEAH box helicase [Fretibacterium sp.]